MSPNVDEHVHVLVSDSMTPRRPTTGASGSERRDWSRARRPRDALRVQTCHRGFLQLNAPAVSPARSGVAGLGVGLALGMVVFGLGYYLSEPVLPGSGRTHSGVLALGAVSIGFGIVAYRRVGRRWSRAHRRLARNARCDWSSRHVIPYLSRHYILHTPSLVVIPAHMY
ncbi:hypothetical protein BRC60_09420 [Halobacteriales archaeon QH_1_68_42]|nr:MAG: hypothetical protein BRC60_09420 [Halobacteriales archaeon QH_1_68_42]